MRISTLQRVVIASSLLLALLVSLMPLPAWLAPYQPQWVALVLMYWVLQAPHRVGMGAALLMGVLLDAAYGTLLGQHALGLLLVTYGVAKFYQRINVFSVWQQALWVFALLLLAQLFYAWAQGLTSQTPHVWSILAPCLSSAVLWGMLVPFVQPSGHHRRHQRA